MENLKVQGLWSKAQMKWYINCKEIMAVILTQKKFVYLLKGKTVKIRTDNIAIKQYINKEGGTGSPTLCKLALQLLTWSVPEEKTHSLNVISSYSFKLSGVTRLNLWFQADSNG